MAEAVDEEWYLEGWWVEEGEKVGAVAFSVLPLVVVVVPFPFVSAWGAMLVVMVGL